MNGVCSIPIIPIITNGVCYVPIQPNIYKKFVKIHHVTFLGGHSVVYKNASQLIKEKVGTTSLIIIQNELKWSFSIYWDTLDMSEANESNVELNCIVLT